MLQMRPARPSDEAGVAAVFNDTWPYSGVAVAKAVSTQPEHFFVAADAERILAFLEYQHWHNWPAIVGMESHDPDINDALLVNWIAVEAPRRGQGIGRQLLGAWLRQLPHGVDYVILNPAPAGEADDEAAELRLRRFYTALGFQLLPNPFSEERSYLLGWSRPGIWLPEPPPWPSQLRRESPPTETSATTAAYIRELKTRMGAV
jgi:GNAT superfamily N-acetyltransferase